MNGKTSPRKEASVTTSKEENLLRIIRDMGYGELHIHVADSQPVRIDEIKKSIKL